MSEPAEQGVQRAVANTLILRALALATQTLEVAGLRSLPLKGAALLACGVTPMWKRHLDDLDLWVPPHDAVRAWNALLERGFTLEGRRPVAHDGRPGEETPTHQLPVLRSIDGTAVEVHLQSHGRGAAGDFDACWASSRPCAVQGTAVRVPSLAHQLEHLCGHVVLHHFGELRLWPRHLADMHDLLRAEPGLAEQRSRPDEVGLSLRVLHGLEHPESVDRLLTRLVVEPPATLRSAWRAGAIAVRAGRFVLGGPGLLRSVFPTAPHLHFTGDLVAGGGLPAAHLRRWRRIAGRLSSPSGVDGD